MKPENLYAWGSTRFYPEWQEKNMSICGEFSSAKDDSSKIKVVFMLPHWNYNVDKDSCIELIDQLAGCDWIYLVIKEHTRPDEGGFTTEERASYEANPNVQLRVNAHSPALIAWADVVINFDSSVGIEALLQNKILINPHFLHDNITIFEETGAALNLATIKEVTEILETVKNKRSISISMIAKKKIYREVIYGGRDEFDVLDHYYRCISLQQAPY